MPVKKREKDCSCGGKMIGKPENKSLFAQTSKEKVIRYTCKTCGNTKQVTE